MTHHRHGRPTTNPFLTLLAALTAGAPIDADPRRMDADFNPLDQEPGDPAPTLHDMQDRAREWDRREQMVDMIRTFNDLLQGQRLDLDTDVEVVQQLTLNLQQARAEADEAKRMVDDLTEDRNYFENRAREVGKEYDLLLSNPAALLAVLEYMRDKGEDALNIVGKIPTIRGVREASRIKDTVAPWGLMEAKHFVESYIMGTFPSKEEIIAGFPAEGEMKAGAPQVSDNGFHVNPDSVEDFDQPTLPPVLDTSQAAPGCCGMPERIPSGDTMIDTGISVAPLDDTNGAVDENTSPYT